MEKIVLPNYDHSILNTVTSFLKYYGVESKYKSSEEIDKRLSAKEYKNVVFIILDGLGEHILNRLSPNEFFSSHKVDVVTSVYPSTTTAALTTYYTGQPPYETGWIAWSQYFKEYGRALDMFSHKESYLGEQLKDVRLDVFKTILNYKPIFEKIEEKNPDVKAYEIAPKYSERRSRRTITADTLDEMLESVEMLCSNPDKKFILAYSDNPDALLHKFGTISDEAKNFIKEAEAKIESLYNKINKEDTLIVISADHGHRDIEEWYSLIDYPEIMECLIIPPSLESRTVAFWVKEDMKIEFVERFNNIFKDKFWLMTKEEFLEKGFLGYGEKHPKVDDFIGNYIALSIGTSIIRLETLLAEGKPIKQSTHCGLTEEEMEVPIILL